MYRTTCTLWLMYTLSSFTNKIRTNATHLMDHMDKQPPLLELDFEQKASHHRQPPPHLTVVRSSFNIQGHGQN